MVGRFERQESGGAGARPIGASAPGQPGRLEIGGEGVSELRVDYGPGYRVYFGQKGQTMVVLLCGGDKRTQDRDIRLSKQYWLEFKASES